MRRDTLLHAVTAQVPGTTVERAPAGGLNLWMRLPDGIDVDRLALDAAARGLLVAPGSEWFPAESPAPFVRLNFSGPDPERYPEAAGLLAESLALQE